MNIEKKDLVDLIGLTVLMYDYEKKFKLEDEESIESFIE